MGFSDLITIASTFKFEEWEIIKLKFKNDKLYYFIWALAILILCGIIGYYSVESHPKFLDIFWWKYGFQPKYWISIWMIVGVVIFWIKLTHSRPSEELVKKYQNYLSIYGPVKFSSLFRK